MSRLSTRSDSTTSLFSVLDHDSFEDDDSPIVDPYNDEIVLVISPVRLESVSPVNAIRKGDSAARATSPSDSEETQDSDNTNEKASNTNEMADDCPPTEPIAESKQELSKWEKWFIEKMEKDRENRRKQLLKRKKQMKLAATEKLKKEQDHQNLKERVRQQRQKQKRKEYRIKSKETAKMEDERQKAEENKMKSAEKFKEWNMKKEEELAQQRKVRREQMAIMRNIAAQKALLAQQSFNDWLLTKDLTHDIRFTKSRMFSTPCAPIKFPAWRGKADSETLPFDFSTRLFLN